eukprot:gene2177-biopygen2089
MPAARGRSDFIDVMGVPVGEADKVDMEMLKKVEELCAILPTMVKCEAAGEHARRMLEALVDLLPEGGLPWHSLEFAALPHGMGLTKATRVSGAAWLGGFAQVWEDMRELFPMVTGGIGDLEAESNLPGGVGAGGGNRYSFIHHKLQRVLFDVAKSAFPLASALHDDFAGYLTYSPNHCPDVTVLGAEGPGRHVMFNVAPAHPMAEAHSGAAMMAPGAAAKREESKVATYGNVGKHQLMPVGVQVEEDVAEQEEVDEGEDMGEDEEGEGPLGCSMGWKQRWIRELSFTLARRVAGMFIRRDQGWCPPRAGWRWAGGGVLDGRGGPGPVRGEEGLQQVE